MPQKYIVQQSIDRGPFVDQSQSLNLFSEVPDYNSLTSSHFYSWKHGLKTGLYYLRSKPTVDPIKFGIDNSSLRKIKYSKKKYNTELIDDDASSDVSDSSDTEQIN